MAPRHREPEGLSAQPTLMPKPLLKAAVTSLSAPVPPDAQSRESKKYPNGVFTHNLINALRGGDTTKDVVSTFDDVKKNVQWEVQANYGVSQVPVLGGKWSGVKLILSTPPASPRPSPLSP